MFILVIYKEYLHHTLGLTLWTPGLVKSTNDKHLYSRITVTVLSLLDHVSSALHSLLSLALNHPPCSQKPGSIVSLQYPTIAGLGLLWIPDLCFGFWCPRRHRGARPLQAWVQARPSLLQLCPSPVAAGSLSLTLLSWPGLAWLLPASAGLEALRSLRLAWRHLSELDIDVFFEIFTMILSRIEDLVSLACYNHKM